MTFMLQFIYEIVETNQLLFINECSLLN